MWEVNPDRRMLSFITELKNLVYKEAKVRLADAENANIFILNLQQFWCSFCLFVFVSCLDHHQLEWYFLEMALIDMDLIAKEDIIAWEPCIRIILYKSATVALLSFRGVNQPCFVKNMRGTSCHLILRHIWSELKYFDNLFCTNKQSCL